MKFSKHDHRFILVFLALFVGACGGESESDDDGALIIEPPQTNLVSQCNFSWEVPNNNPPEIPILSGTVCTDSVDICRQEPSAWASDAGYSLDVNDITTQISTVNTCTSQAATITNIPNDNFNQPTLYGIGATSLGPEIGITTAVAINVLKSDNLLRDPLQIPPSSEEENLAQFNDDSRKNNGGLVFFRPPVGSTILSNAGVSELAPLFVEDDLRLNQVLNSIGGGHAGHTYFSIDGKFVDILSEIANWVYYRDNGQLAPGYENIDLAIDAIMSCHLPSIGRVNACTFPYTENASYIYESLYAAIVYHEFAHYFLMHVVDMQRANLFYDTSTLFTSIQEDDADFIAGALQAKAGYDLVLGQDMFDMMTLYSMLKSGIFITYTGLNQNFQLQFTSNSPAYSPLSVRKQNFARGYRSFN